MTDRTASEVAVGRPRTINTDLPPRIKRRTTPSGRTLYYYTGFSSQVPMGEDYFGVVLHRYADLEKQRAGGVVVGGVTFNSVADEWEKNGIQLGKRGKPRAASTREHYLRCLPELRKFFGDNRLDLIEPLHIRQFLTKRSHKVQANREIAVFSLIWNWARNVGKTAKPNPCPGVERNFESPRERYVHDAEYQAVWEKLPFWAQDAVDLLKLTYQRPSDVLRASRTDISDGYLWFKQGKTGKRLGFSIEGEFKAVIERIQSRQRPGVVTSLRLVADERGQPVTRRRLGDALINARGGSDWQLRDLRAKAITDTEDIRVASQRAGHSKLSTTQFVYDRTRGRKVGPLR